MNTPPCPYCQRSDAIIKNGRNHTGTQKYRCQHCQCNFTPAPKPEGHAATLRHSALQLYLDGMSLRKIGKRLGVHHQSVANWVHAAAQHVPQTVTSSTPTATIEVDELHSFIADKKSRST